MKRILLVFAFLSYVVLAQTVPATKEMASLPKGVRVLATLKTSLDTSRAEPGDGIELAVTANLRGPGGTVALPAGTKLTGKVTTAESKSKLQSDSRLAIVVDRAEWRGGTMRLKMVFALTQPAPPVVVAETGTWHRSVSSQQSAGIGTNCMVNSDITERPAIWTDNQDAASPADSFRDPFGGVAMTSDKKLGVIAVSDRPHIVIPADSRINLIQVE